MKLYISNKSTIWKGGEMLKSGWIKCPRELLYDEDLKDPKIFKLFMSILVQANFESKTFRGNVIQPGEFITSLAKLGGPLGLTDSRIRTALKRFEEQGKIARLKIKKGTKIKVLIWGSDLKNAEIMPETSHKGCLNNAQNVATTKEVKKKEIRNKKETKPKKIVPDCDFFQCDELNKWVGKLPESTKERWCRYADYELMEEMAYEAKEWTEVNNKTKKNYPKFLEDWWKRDKRFADAIHNRKITEFFAKYER